MATERQIAANRANATKSTGPVTPEGKRISSQNRSIDKLLSDSAAFKSALKGESLRRYNTFTAALILEFQTEFQQLDAAGTALIQTMTVARWRTLCVRRIQNTTLRREIARVRRDHPSAASRATLIAIAFRRLTANSSSYTAACRLELHYDCEYHRALAKLSKLGKIPKSFAIPHAPTPKDGETGICDFSTEPNFKTVFARPSQVHLIHRE